MTEGTPLEPNLMMPTNPMLLLCGLMLLGSAPGLVGCKTDEPGVRSSYRSQWTTVAANTTKATEAAKDVLEDLKLQRIQSTATALDGSASGYTADNTRVTVEVRKITESTSEVAVNVGAMGDPALGKDIIARIKKELGG